MFPATESCTTRVGVSEMEMLVPVAVKGPVETRAEGRVSSNPVDGRGVGIGASKFSGGLLRLAGVAPVASKVGWPIR